MNISPAIRIAIILSLCSGATHAQDKISVSAQLEKNAADATIVTFIVTNTSDATISLPEEGLPWSLPTNCDLELATSTNPKQLLARSFPIKSVNPATLKVLPKQQVRGNLWLNLQFLELSNTLETSDVTVRWSYDGSLLGDLLARPATGVVKLPRFTKAQPQK